MLQPRKHNKATKSLPLIITADCIQSCLIINVDFIAVSTFMGSAKDVPKNTWTSCLPSVFLVTFILLKKVLLRNTKS